MGNSMEVPQKIKTKILYDSVFLKLSIHPKKMKQVYQRDISILLFTVAI
jgi:hypothetical protein